METVKRGRTWRHQKNSIYVELKVKRVFKQDWSRNLNLNLIPPKITLIFSFSLFFLCTLYLQTFSNQMSKNLGFRLHQPQIEVALKIRRLPYNATSGWNIHKADF